MKKFHFKACPFRNEANSLYTHWAYFHIKLQLKFVGFFQYWQKASVNIAKIYILIGWSWPFLTKERVHLNFFTENIQIQTHEEFLPKVIPNVGTTVSTVEIPLIKYNYDETLFYLFIHITFECLFDIYIFQS